MKTILRNMNYYSIWKVNWNKVINEWKQKYSYTFLKSSNDELQQSLLELQEFQDETNEILEDTISNLQETISNHKIQLIEQNTIIKKLLKQISTLQSKLDKIDETPLVKMKEEIRMLRYDWEQEKKTREKEEPFEITLLKDIDKILIEFTINKSKGSFQNVKKNFECQLIHYVINYYKLTPNTINYEFVSIYLDSSRTGTCDSNWIMRRKIQDCWQKSLN